MTGKETHTVHFYLKEDNQEMMDEEEKKESDVTSICHLCGNKITGLTLKWNGFDVTGALMVHLNSNCSYV